MNALQDHSEANLAEVAPVLDEAINQLGEEDRAVILLRFFEQLEFRSVGETLGSSEEAARKRATRALEKLHALKRQGMSLSVATLLERLLQRRPSQRRLLDSQPASRVRPWPAWERQRERNSPF